LDPYILLSFGTIYGQTRSIRVIRPNMQATDSQVRNTMNAMIGSNVVADHRGRINSLRRAALTQHVLTPIVLPTP